MLSMKQRQVSLRLLKVAIVLLVAWGIYRAFEGARVELQARPIDWHQLSLGCFGLAALCYFSAQVPMAWFWQQTLRAFGQEARFRETFRAFFIGHLGKYVPGKFMVVLLRSGLIGEARIDPVLAGVSVFVETLTGMACGACLAATILFVWFPAERGLQAVAVALMLATMLGTLPPVMRRLMQFVQTRRGTPMSRERLANIHLGLILKGWLAASMMWALTAVCFWWVLKGLPGTSGLTFNGATLVRLTASVCLAVVAGFASLIPGGLGIREWVLNQLLIPEFGKATALMAAVALRLVMLLTELAGSIILYGTMPRRSPSETNS